MTTGAAQTLWRSYRTLPGRRGSLTIDDEGTPSGNNVLIEKGILKGYMQDRMNAGLMGVAPTGNGRREGYGSVTIELVAGANRMKAFQDVDQAVSRIRTAIESL